MSTKLAIMTVDVEDWFHILDNPLSKTETEWLSFPSRLDDGLRRILDLFDCYDQKATFFVLGWIARKYPHAVNEIVQRGHEIASHSDMHELIYTQSPDAFEADLVHSLDSIEKVTGYRPTIYRAPGFSITENSTWAFEILVQNGIEVDCSIFPAARSHGGLPMFPADGPCVVQTPLGHTLREFPISLGYLLGRRFIYSGGGYFRLFPARLLKYFFIKSDYVMTYFHPRDFDPDQPLVPGLSAMRQFKSYVGLKSALHKLEMLLSQLNFVTLGEAVNMVKWSDVKRIRID